MKIVCTSSVYLGEEAFSTLGETLVVPDDELRPVVIADADLLIARSRNLLGEHLLQGSNVSFVGTATAGIDHLDAAYLEATGRAWCCAPGCNANAAAEYIVTALLYLAERHSMVLEEMTLGVVGAGQVGHRVVEKAEALGMSVLLNDPPLREETGLLDYEPLETVLAQSDIISLHVPLVNTRPWPTAGLCNHRFFEMMKPGALFINASRGEVVDPAALQSVLDAGSLSGCVLDVWPGEPFFDVELLRKVDIGTPHIAGHSLEGKANGTFQVYQQAAGFLEMEPTWEPGELPAGQGAKKVTLQTNGRDDEHVLAELVRQVYDIVVDDRNLRTSINMDRAARGQHFETARKEYRVRREFPATRVDVEQASPTLLRKIEGLGFTLGQVSV